VLFFEEYDCRYALQYWRKYYLVIAISTYSIYNPATQSRTAKTSSITNSHSIYSNNEAVNRIYSMQRNVRPYWCNPSFSSPASSSYPRKRDFFFCFWFTVVSAPISFKIRWQNDVWRCVLAPHFATVFEFGE